MSGLYFYDDTRNTFLTWAREFCQRNPRYQQRDGSPALGHILNAANAEGYSEINAGNIAAVQAALERRAVQRKNDRRNLEEERYPIDAEDL